MQICAVLCHLLQATADLLWTPLLPCSLRKSVGNMDIPSWESLSSQHCIFGKQSMIFFEGCWTGSSGKDDQEKKEEEDKERKRYSSIFISAV